MQPVCRYETFYFYSLVDEGVKRQAPEETLEESEIKVNVFHAVI